MNLETNEASAKAGPGDLRGGDPGNLSETEAWEQELVARYGVTALHARIILNALRQEVY